MDPMSRFAHCSFGTRGICTILLSVALTALLALVTAAAAEEAEAKLPEDGMWARYAGEWEQLNNGAKTSHKVTLSFVGRVMEGDEPCQWIEINTVVPAGDPEQGTYIHKLLVRQKDLLESKNPLEKIVRVWSKFKDKEPVDVSPDEHRHDIMFGPLMLWTPGVLKAAGRSDQAKDVDYQKGRLKACRPRTGSLSLPVRDANGTIVVTWSRTYTAWQHADLPIGFSQAQVTDEVAAADGKVRSLLLGVYLLEDAGTGAKSELPDKN